MIICLLSDRIFIQRNQMVQCTKEVKKKAKFYKNFNTVIDKIQLSKFANSIYRMYFCAV